MPFDLPSDPYEPGSGGPEGNFGRGVLFCLAIAGGVWALLLVIWPWLWAIAGSIGGKILAHF